jgi:hypothetical protein
MATRTYQAQASSVEASSTGVRGGGWLAFAGVMLGIAGGWNVIDGSLALANSKVYGVNTVYVFSDLRTWGWIALGLGIAQLFAAFAIFSGSEIARWFGIVVAGVNALAQLAWIPVYPFWGLMIFAADIIVIYALAVYGGKQLRYE